MKMEVEEEESLLEGYGWRDGGYLSAVYHRRRRWRGRVLCERLVGGT